MPDLCPDCNAPLPRGRGGCRACPWRPEPAVTPPPTSSGDQWTGPRTCGIRGCGAELGTDDWCPVGDGYPLAARQDVRRVARLRGRYDAQPERFDRQAYQEVQVPWICPLCRSRLTWDGGCDGCRGSRTPQDRTTWTFPGDRYELSDDGPPHGRHYRFVANGPRPVATEAETLAALAELAAVVQVAQDRHAPEHAMGRPAR